MTLSRTLYDAGIDNDIVDDDSILAAEVDGRADRHGGQRLPGAGLRSGDDGPALRPPEGAGARRERRHRDLLRTAPLGQHRGGARRSGAGRPPRADPRRLARDRDAVVGASRKITPAASPRSCRTGRRRSRSSCPTTSNATSSPTAEGSSSTTGASARSTSISSRIRRRRPIDARRAVPRRRGAGDLGCVHRRGPSRGPVRESSRRDACAAPSGRQLRRAVRLPPRRPASGARVRRPEPPRALESEPSLRTGSSR